MFTVMTSDEGLGRKRERQFRSSM